MSNKRLSMIQHFVSPLNRNPIKKADQTRVVFTGGTYIKSKHGELPDKIEVKELEPKTGEQTKPENGNTGVI